MCSMCLFGVCRIEAVTSTGQMGSVIRLKQFLEVCYLNANVSINSSCSLCSAFLQTQNLKCFTQNPPKSSKKRSVFAAKCSFICTVWVKAAFLDTTCNVLLIKDSKLPGFKYSSAVKSAAFRFLQRSFMIGASVPRHHSGFFSLSLMWATEVGNHI